MVDSYLMLFSKYSVTFYFIKWCWELEWLNDFGANSSEWDYYRAFYNKFNIYRFKF